MDSPRLLVSRSISFGRLLKRTGTKIGESTLKTNSTKVYFVLNQL